MVRAKFYKRLKKDKIVQCLLCPHYCVIKNGEKGKCKVRKNENGHLNVLNYAKACAKSIDIIEKKPLFHFLPGTKTFSIATIGCNMMCQFCQNWEISQTELEKIPSINLMPEQIVSEALKKKCDSISYTYTEPTIFYEYILDIAKLAKKRGLKNVCVTNGYINKEPLKMLYKNIDAVNVDLKAFNNKFYETICMAKLEPVLKTLKILKKMNIWIEISFLVIPKQNDKENEFKEMCLWIKNNLDENTPLHLLKFFPMYNMQFKDPTSDKKMKKLYEIAKNIGLKYVYLGNMSSDKSVYCPNCGNLLIKRNNHFISYKHLSNNKCERCNTLIRGVWFG